MTTTKEKDERVKYDAEVAAMFPSGTVVRLHSGGSLMTVSHCISWLRALHTDEKVGVHVCWHDDCGEPHAEAYYADMLIVERRPSGLRVSKKLEEQEA